MAVGYVVHKILGTQVVEVGVGIGLISKDVSALNPVSQHDKSYRIFVDLFLNYESGGFDVVFFECTQDSVVNFSVRPETERVKSRKIIKG